MKSVSLGKRATAAGIVALVCLSIFSALPDRSSAANGSVSDALFRKGIAAKGGTVVRRDDGVKVTRVTVRHQGADVRLYVVRVAGDFPPRALRYVVSAGGHRVGFGVPVADTSAVRTVTRDPSVLTEPIRARYRSATPSDESARLLGGGTQGNVPDPGALGPLAVRRVRYDLGDQVFQPTDIGAKIELIAQVHYPANLAGGPYPLVLFLHGNHGTCYRSGDDLTNFTWPCRDRWKPIPNYSGYGYIARSLASRGAIVASISANGVNALGSNLRDTAMKQRGELIDRHLELWEEWSTTGGEPFGDDFIGAVDMSRIGTMGHSRGGEGVVWHKVVDDQRPDPFGVDAVLSLAPVDFTRMTITGVPFATVLPTCDGDVFDLQGVHLYDDSRYEQPGDEGAKHTVTLYGANHNFFNTVWSPSSRFPGTMDDGEFSSCFGERLNETRQRRIGRAYIVGFFRRYLLGDDSVETMWTGAGRPGFMKAREVAISYHGGASDRRDIARFDGPEDLSQSELGGDVEPERLSQYQWCEDTRSLPCVGKEFQDPDRHRPGLSRAFFGWTRRTAEIGWVLPAGQRDVSAFEALQFRAMARPGGPLNRNIRIQDLSATLIDGDGDEFEVLASEVGNSALRVQKGFIPHLLMQQVRFPLDRFEGVDLTDVREVELRFDRNQKGALYMSDVNFSRGAP